MALEQNNSLEEEQTRQALDTLIAIQQSQKDSPEPSVLGEAKTEVQEQYTPEERARLRTRAKQQEIFTKIFQAIESDLNKEEKTCLKQVMEEQIAKI